MVTRKRVERSPPRRKRVKYGGDNRRLASDIDNRIDLPSYEGEYPELSERSRYEFRALLQIDKYALDKDIITQPTLFYEVSDKLDKAVAVRDAAKDKMNDIEKEVARELRLKMEKTTEKAVYEQVAADARLRSAVLWYYECKRNSDGWATLKEAFSMRASMLKQVASLFVTNYFSTDSMKSGDTEEARHSYTREAMHRDRQSRRNRSERKW